jgi:hypothetical protein
MSHYENAMFFPSFTPVISPAISSLINLLLHLHFSARRAKMSSSLVKLKKRENEFFMELEASIWLYSRFVPNSSAQFLSLLPHFICHLFVCFIMQFWFRQMLCKTRCQNKFGIRSHRCCVTAWEFSRDFDFEGKSSIVVRTAAAMKRERNGATDILITKLSYALKLKILK